MENDSPLVKEVSRQLSKSGWKSTLTVSNEKFGFLAVKRQGLDLSAVYSKLLKVFEYGFYYFSNN